jgi:alpha-beta hydrolase superfamily lysophospholipase
LSKAALPDLPLWVMGQSAGCAALVEYARNYPWPFVGAVLLAPLVRPVSWTKVRVGHMLLQHFTDSMPREFRKNSSDQEFLEFIRRDPLQSSRISLRWVKALRRWLASLPQEDLGVGPALVLQGDTDGTVDWRYNMTVIEKLFPGSQIEYLPGAGHHLANESAAHRERYLTVVDAYLESRGLWSGQSLTDSSLLT